MSNYNQNFHQILQNTTMNNYISNIQQQQQQQQQHTTQNSNTTTSLQPQQQTSHSQHPTLISSNGNTFANTVNSLNRVISNASSSVTTSGKAKKRRRTEVGPGDTLYTCDQCDFKTTGSGIAIFWFLGCVVFLTRSQKTNLISSSFYSQIQLPLSYQTTSGTYLFLSTL